MKRVSTHFTPALVAQNALSVVMLAINIPHAYIKMTQQGVTQVNSG